VKESGSTRRFEPDEGARPVPDRGKAPVQVAAEAIRARAYEISVARRQNGDEGDELSDWLQAEQELSGPMITGPGEARDPLALDPRHQHR
jgi:hypothetical protein